MQRGKTDSVGALTGILGAAQALEVEVCVEQQGVHGVVALAEGGLGGGQGGDEVVAFAEAEPADLASM
ncbi:hypothetical protein GCM10027074_75560 [Streptomyces deserti]